MNQDDIRVRISAEGLRDIEGVFKKIRDESKKTETSVSGIGKAAAGVKNILGTLGVAATAASIASLVRSSIDAADSIGDLASASGGTAENLSLYVFAAKEANVEQETLKKGIVELARSFAGLENGEKKATDLFAQLGLTAKDFSGLSFDEKMNKFAVALGSIEGSAGKIDLAKALLGRGGTDLIEVFDNITNEGLPQFAARAKETGAVISTDFANAANQVTKDLGDMKQALTANTNEFLTGFLPAYRAMKNEVSGGNTTMGSTWRTLGQITGAVLSTATGAFSIFVKTLVYGAFLMVDSFDVLGTLMDDVIHGRFKQLGPSAREGLGRIKAVATEFLRDTDAVGKEIDASWKAIGSAPERAFAESDAPQTSKQVKQLEKVITDEQKAALKDQLAAQVKAIDDELKAINDRFRNEAAVEKDAYEKGKQSLTDYIADRKRLIDMQAEQERALLEKKLALADTDKERAAVRGEIAKSEQDQKLQLAALTREAGTEQEALDSKRVEFQNKLLEMQGRRHEVEMSNLDAETKKYQEFLIQSGASAEEQARKIAAFRAQGQANINFDIAKENLQNAISELDRAKELATTEEQIAKIERDRLPNLQALATEMKNAAENTGDQQKINDAADMSAGVQQISQNVAQANDSFRTLRQGAYDALVNGFSNFLTQGIKDADSFGEAVQNMAAGIVQAMAQVIAQMIAIQAVKGLFGAFNIQIPGGFSGGGAVTAATGGYIRGPGTGTSDSIPAWLSDGEFVVRSATVRDPGALQFLRDFNRYGMAALHLHAGRGYADGGLVQASPGSGLSGSLTIGLEPGVSLREMDSPEGHRIVIKALAGNRKAARGAMGG